MNKIEKLQDQIDRLEAELISLDIVIGVMESRILQSIHASASYPKHISVLKKLYDRLDIEKQGAEYDLDDLLLSIS